MRIQNLLYRSLPCFLLLFSLSAIFSSKGLAQWIGATRDTLTDDLFRDENSSQCIACDNSNTLHVVWQRANSGSGWRVFYGRGGATPWSTPIEVGDSSLTSFHPALAVESGTGTPWVVYQASYATSDEIVIAKDSTSAWGRTRLTNNTTPDFSPTIAIDPSNKVHLAWIGQDASSNWKIVYATNLNGNWQTQLLTGSSLGGFGSGAAPFIAVTQSGVAHIFYRGGDYPDYHIHHATNSLPGDTAWSFEIVTTPNANDFTSSAVIDTQGTLHLLASGNDGFGFPPHAYYTQKVLGGSWSSPELANPGGTGNGGSLIIDRFGKAHITWDEVNGNIITGNLYYATNKSGAWTSVPVQLDNQTYSGVLTVDGMRRGHILAYNGATFPMQEIIVIHSNGVLTGLDEDEVKAPVRFTLYQNHPNPFNPTTAIQFALGTAGQTSLQVFDLLGRDVGTLVNESKLPGMYTVIFDGARLASGVYYYRLQVDGHVDVKKLILLR